MGILIRLFGIVGHYMTNLGKLLDDRLSSYPSLLGRKALFDLLEPHPTAPVSAFTRDPWWYPCYAPYIPSYAQWSTPFYLRDSYLSPVKRNYLWSRHPLRPFGTFSNLSTTISQIDQPKSKLFYYHLLGLY